MGKISLFGAVSIGIGGMVGGGIFAVLGEAVMLAHGATPFAFIIAGIVALFSAYAYAKLSVVYQSEGGTVTFIDNAFGSNTFSGAISVMLWFNYLITISLYATAFGSYAQTFFSASPLLYHTLVSAAIIVAALINSVSATFVSRSEGTLVAIKVLLLLTIIVVSVRFVNSDAIAMTAVSPSQMVMAGMVIFVAYEGFELIANAAKDINNPVKNLPRALYISVSVVIALYIAIAIVTVGTVDEATLVHAKDYALAEAAKPALGHVGFVLVAIAAMISTFSAINATIYGNARLSFVIAKEGELPSFLLQLHHSIPINSIVATTVLSLLLANTIALNSIAIIGSAGFLLIFLLVSLSAFKLRQEINANATVLVVGMLLCAMSLVALLYHAASDSLVSLVLFISFIVVSLLFELLYGKYRRRQLFGRQYK